MKKNLFWITFILAVLALCVAKVHYFGWPESGPVRERTAAEKQADEAMLAASTAGIVGQM